MADRLTELGRWQDWTDPDFFMVGRQKEQRLVPLFFRQILPKQAQKTRLTFTGWMLIVVALGIGSSAYNTSSNILFMALSLVLSSLVLSGILSLINFRQLSWTLKVPEHLQAGEPVLAEVELENRKRIFPSMNLAFNLAHSEAGAPERVYLGHSVSAGRRSSVEWSFVPKKRGRLDVSLHGVESKFPFGFLNKRIGDTFSESVLVWPARADYAFEPRTRGHRLRNGATLNRSGSGSDLLNIRAYQRGDAPRLIHWKATARMKRLMVRQLAQEGDSGFHMQVNLSAGAWDADTLEVLCSVACALSEDLFHEGRLDTVAVGAEMPVPVRGLREVHDFFDRLAILGLTEPVQSTPKRGAHRHHVNTITFKPSGSGGVIIYVNGESAGQA